MVNYLKRCFWHTLITGILLFVVGVICVSVAPLAIKLNKPWSGVALVILAIFFYAGTILSFITSRSCWLQIKALIDDRRVM